MSTVNKVQGKRLLLVGGLGHTDLSGKVPRPGLLMLRKALRAAGHDAVIANYATSLMNQMFPQEHVNRLSQIYNRTIKPMVLDGKNPLYRPWKWISTIRDIKNLKMISSDLQEAEKQAYEKVGYEIADRINNEGFAAVGIPLYMGGSTLAGITIANILREAHPRLPIIFGGPQATLFAETIYRKTKAPTALVLGEGEEAIVGIAKIIDSLKAGSLDDLSKIPNIVYRDQSGTILATQRKRMSWRKWLNFSGNIYEEGDFKSVMKYAFIETSRGCLWKCRFCPQWILSGSERYLKSEESIVDEMINLNKKFGITHFELVGSSTPPKQAEKIADEIIKRQPEEKFSWGLFMRGHDEKMPNLKVLMGKLKQAGASTIFFGVEAADDKTLNEMQKGTTIKETKDAMLAAEQAGIETIGSFIYPYPGMPENEADLIIKFLKKVNPLSAPSIPLGLFPGTYCSENAEKIGLEIVYPRPRDQKLYLKGEKPKPTMQSPEVLEYLLTFPLILSLPMSLWQPLPHKIDGMNYRQYVRKLNKLQKRIAKLGILLGFSHSHYLISQVLEMAPQEFSERIFYCSLTGDYKTTRELIDRFNRNIGN